VDGKIQPITSTPREASASHQLAVVGTPFLVVKAHGTSLVERSYIIKYLNTWEQSRIRSGLRRHVQRNDDHSEEDRKTKLWL
jgi:hypothetical protein